MVSRILVFLLCFLLAAGPAASQVEIDTDANNAVDIAKGGTNATTAAGARSNLGLVIGTHVLSPGGDGSGLTGVLKSEVDPVFAGSAAYGVTLSLINNWNTCFGWGDHAGLYEPGLGLPAADGYILSSTAAGVRSWVAAGSGSGDMLKSVYDANADNLIDDAAIAASIARDSELWPVQADCTGITAGCCLDSDNGYLYCWDGDSVEEVSRPGSVVSLPDPDADRIMFWDDSEGVPAFLSPDGTIEIFDTTMRVADGSIAKVKMADGDWGDFALSSNVATLDTGVVTSNEIGEIPEQKDWSITNPDNDDFYLFKAQRAITITDIHCIAVGGGTIAINIQACDSYGANCAPVDAAIMCDSDGSEDDGSLSNAAIAAGDWVYVDMGAVSGTVTSAAWSIYYGEDK